MKCISRINHVICISDLKLFVFIFVIYIILMRTFLFIPESCINLTTYNQDNIVNSSEYQDEDNCIQVKISPKPV